MQIRDFMDDAAWTDQMLGHAQMEKQSSMTRSAVLGLPLDKFAGVFVDEHLMRHPRFAMDTPTNLQLSALYLTSGGHGLRKEAQAQVARNMLEGFFGHNMIAPEEIQKLAAQASDYSLYMRVQDAVDPRIFHQAQEFSDADFAVKVAGVGRFPVRDEREANQAVGWLEDNLMDVPPEFRRPLVSGIQKKASAFNVGVGRESQRYLGEERSWLFKWAMKGRAVAAPAYAEMYAGLADSDLPLSELAEKLAEIDTMAQINPLWDKAIQDPWATVYDGTEKVGEEQFRHTLGGEVVTGEDLKRVAVTKPALVGELLGHVASEPFLKNPVEFYRKADPRLQRIIIDISKRVRLAAR